MNRQWRRRLRHRDRKSTRLNSSHVKISYAVFCLSNRHNVLFFPTRRSSDLTPEKLAAALLAQLENSVAMQQLHETFLFIHRQLKRSADDEAAAAIAGLLQQ